MLWISVALAGSLVAFTVFLLVASQRPYDADPFVVGGRTVRQGWRFGRPHQTVIEAPELPAGLALRPAGRSSEGADDRIGDPDFDGLFQVQLGELGIAWLDAAARLALVEMCRPRREDEPLLMACAPSGVRVEDRAVTFASTHLPQRDDVERMVALVDHLAVRDPRGALEGIVANDGFPGVRARALVTLAAAFPEDDVWASVEQLTRAPVALLRATALLLTGRDDGLADAVEACAVKDRWEALELAGRHGSSVQLAAVITAVSRPPFSNPVWAQAATVARAHPSGPVMRAIGEAARVLAVGDRRRFVADYAVLALTGGERADVHEHLVRLLPFAERRASEGRAWLARRD